MEQEIQRLQDIKNDENEKILALSKNEQEVYNDIERRTIDQLLPLLIKKQLDDEEYEKGTRIIDKIQSDIKDILASHQEKEIIFLKENMQKGPDNRFVTDTAYSTYEKNFDNPIKKDFNEEIFNQHQQKIYQTFIKKVSKGKISKEKNDILDNRLGRDHDHQRKSYITNTLDTTIYDLQNILKKSHTSYEQEQKQQKDLFKKYHTIYTGRDHHKVTNDISNKFLNKSKQERNIEAFSAYLKEKKIKTTSHKGKERNMEFKDIKRMFLSFGEEYFSDSTWLAIISGEHDTVMDRIHTYNKIIIDTAEDQEIKAMKEIFVSFFSEEEKRKKTQKNYRNVCTFGFTPRAIERLRKEYDIDIGKNISEIAKRFGWLEHIIKNKKTCETYIRAWTNNDRSTLYTIIKAHPIKITWPTEKEIKDSTHSYTNLLILDKARQEQGTSWTTSSGLSLGNRKKEPTRLITPSKITITKQDFLEKVDTIFPKKTYAEVEYTKYRNSLTPNEQKRRGKNLSSMLPIFNIHPDYLNSDLMKALITGDKKTERRIITEKNRNLWEKSHRPEHIKTLLVFCDLLESENRESAYLDISDLQQTSFARDIDQQKGISKRTNDNITSVEKKYGITKRWKTPSAIQANLLGKFMFEKDSEELYEALFQTRAKLIEDGFIRKEQIKAILQPGGEKHINQSLDAGI